MKRVDIDYRWHGGKPISVERGVKIRPTEKGIIAFSEKNGPLLLPRKMEPTDGVLTVVADDIPRYRKRLEKRHPELAKPDRWSFAVTHRRPATFPRPGTHTLSAREMFDEYMKPEVSPNGINSAIQMLAFYRNRAGTNLRRERVRAINKTIRMLQAERDKNQPES